MTKGTNGGLTALQMIAAGLEGWGRARRRKEARELARRVPAVIHVENLTVNVYLKSTVVLQLLERRRELALLIADGEEGADDLEAEIRRLTRILSSHGFNDCSDKALGHWLAGDRWTELAEERRGQDSTIVEELWDFTREHSVLIRRRRELVAKGEPLEAVDSRLRTVRDSIAGSRLMLAHLGVSLPERKAEPQNSLGNRIQILIEEKNRYAAQFAENPELAAKLERRYDEQIAALLDDEAEDSDPPDWKRA